MSDTVIVIHASEDGDLPVIETIGKDVLRARLKEEYYGRNLQFAEPANRIDTGEFLGLIVIEGRIVKPRPVDRVIDWEI